MKWLYENFPISDNKNESSVSYGYAINRVLYSGKSEYQQVDVVETPFYGKALFIDHLMMTNEKDEFIYHELLTHIPSAQVKNPERAVIIGGGDGGIARELCKYKSIKEIVVAEIDDMVINASRKHLPLIACGFDDPRVKIQVGDGAEYIKNQPDKSFDLILIDSTEPIGPGITLFKEEFYRTCSQKLKDGGQFSAQGLCPFYYIESQKLMYAALKKTFKHVKPYMGVIPTYPTALWLFFNASNNEIKIDNEAKNRIPNDTKYVSGSILEACYAVPRFVEKELI